MPILKQEFVDDTTPIWWTMSLYSHKPVLGIPSSALVQDSKEIGEAGR